MLQNIVSCLLHLMLVTGFSITMCGQDQELRENPYLVNARQCANWLHSVSVVDDDKISWPVTPGDSNRASAILYDGVPGVVLFYIEMYHATGEQAYLKLAIGGGDWLIAQADKFDTKTNPALFTGLAGVGFTLDQLFRVSRKERFAAAGQRCFEFVKSSAKTHSQGSRLRASWNDVTDIIGGTAGIGIYLLDSHRRLQRSGALELAIAAGDDLLASADKVSLASRQSGLRWMMSPTFPREMPNYSHGTAGISDFLLLLDDETKRSDKHADDYDRRFLDASRQGAIYLESLAQVPENNYLIPHHFPDGGQLYYLGWCHGPAGTVGFLNRLAAQDGDARWSTLSRRLVDALLATNIPHQRPDGFWNNAGLCCGNAGTASFLYDHYKTCGDARTSSLADKLTVDILNRATKVNLKHGQTGLKWMHAEHRARPQYLKAQTGLMQGAAGIGIWFLKYYQIERGKSLSTELDALPF